MPSLAASLARIPAPPVIDPWLTLQEAADEAKASAQTLRRAIINGTLRAVKLNRAHRYRLRRSWLTAWLEGDGGDPRL